MKKYFLTFIFIFFFVLEVLYAKDFDVTAKNIVLYNLNDNEIIYSKNKDEKTTVASLTKIMTSIVAIENISDLNKEVIVKEDDFKELKGYSKAGLKIGDRLTYMDLLYGIMLSSGADSVNALVNNSMGYDKFITKMNETAKKIGLNNTHFTNPIGKDDNNLNYSTANDIAKLLKYALKNEAVKKIFETKIYKTSNNIIFKSTLSYYDNILDTSKIIGAKSGYTPNSGRCLASISSLNNVNYLLVVINSSNDDISNAVRDSLTIYNYYNDNYKYTKILEKDYIIKKIPVKLSRQKYYKIRSNESIEAYLKKDYNISYKFDGVKQIEYKTKKNTYLGNLNIYNNHELIKVKKIYLEDSIIYYNILLWIIVGILLFIFIILFIIAIIIKKKKESKYKIIDIS